MLRGLRPMFETNHGPPAPRPGRLDEEDDDGLGAALDDDDLREFATGTTNSPTKRGRQESEEDGVLASLPGEMDYETGRGQRTFAPRPFRAVQSMPARSMFDNAGDGERESWQREIDAGLRTDPDAWQ
jgi:hypothetical protein